MEKRLIQEGEIRPYEIYIGVPDGSDISSVTCTVYDVSDGTKAAITSFADAFPLSNGVRLICQGATYGTTYRVLMEALMSTGETKAKVVLVECRKQAEKVRTIRPKTREMFLLDFTDDLPTSLGMDYSSSTSTAYVLTDLSTDISSTIVQGITADSTNDQRLRVDVDNLTAWDDVLVSVLGYSDLDSVSNLVYRIRKNIIIPCVED